MGQIFPTFKISYIIILETEINENALDSPIHKVVDMFTTTDWILSKTSCNFQIGTLALFGFYPTYITEHDFNYHGLICVSRLF